MGSRFNISCVKKLLRQVDWKLVLFLLLFVHVKLVVKIAAVVLMYILRPDTGFGIKWKNSRLPFFYVLIIGIALADAVVYKSFLSASNTLAVLTGIGFWILCLLAVHQVKLSVERNEPAVLHNTVLLFFFVNMVCSLVNITSIIVETGAINPYRFQGNYQKYFISTGDYIKGVSFDTSITNAVINAFAVIYFLIREKVWWLVASMAVLLLTGSNIICLLLLGMFAGLFIFKSSANQKSLMIICSAMLVVFFAKVSPQNNSYFYTGLRNIFFAGKTAAPTASLPAPPASRISNSMAAEERRQQTALHYLDSLSLLEAVRNPVAAPVEANTKPFIPVPSIHSIPFQRKHDTTPLQHELAAFATANHIPLRSVDPPPGKRVLPGKLTALLEVFSFFQHHPYKLIQGNGMGNFSSKLAFRTTALDVAGGYPVRYRYICDDFKKNHLALFLSYFTADREHHSLANTPSSTYGQLLGEYGLLGLTAFVAFYFGFFLNSYKRLTYGLPVLLMMGGVFLLDYWFEQLSVVLIFELLLLLNMKEYKYTKPLNV